MRRDPDFEADLARYPPRPFLKEQSIWAIWIYRLGRRLLSRKHGRIQNIQLKLYWLIFRVVETLTGISLPLDADIGPGLRIHHFGNIFVHSNAVIGCNCTLRQGVTIGDRIMDGSVPVIGDDVEFGAYAQALGSIKIGSGAKIGAMSLVLSDVPAGTTVLGIPARIVANRPNEPTPPQIRSDPFS
jgi:serine O-acetyltransferase